MANRQIDQLPDAQPANDDDLLIVSQGGRTRRKALAALKAEAFTDAGIPSAPQGGLTGSTVRAQLAQLDARASAKVSRAGDAMTGPLTIPAATQPGHAVNKAQLDAETARATAAEQAASEAAGVAAAAAAAASGKVSKAGDTMTGQLVVPDGVQAGHAVNRRQLDPVATAASQAGADAASALDAATSAQASAVTNAAAIATKLDKAGGTLTGTLVLAGAGTQANHAATKGQVDATVSASHGVDITKAPWNGKADGSADCSPILAAIFAAGFRRVYHPAGTYRYDTPVQAPCNSTVAGENLHTTEIVAGGARWLELMRNTDTQFTTDWARCRVTGFTVNMAAGGILAHGHENRLDHLRFRQGAAGAWCIELHAANECHVSKISGGYGGGAAAFDLKANGLRWYATDAAEERTVNYGDGSVFEVSFKGSVPNWQGVVLEHLSTDTSLGSINNIFMARVQCQAPAPQGNPNAVAAGSVWAFSGSVGLALSRVQRSTFHTVDLEGNNVAIFAKGAALNLGSASTRRNTFIGVQSLNSTFPWIDTNGSDANTSPASLVPSSLDGSVGQNCFINSQDSGPLQPTGLANGDPGGSFGGRRSTYDTLLPGGMWFARPGNGQFKGVVRYTDDEAWYFTGDSQDAAGEPFAGMPKFQTPARALGVRVNHSPNEAHLFRPRSYAAGREHRITIGNGEGFTLGTTVVGPLHRVQIADPLWIAPWAGQPQGLGGNVPGVMVNASAAAVLGSPSTGYYVGPGLYALINDNTVAGTFSGQWVPVSPRPGFGVAQGGKSGSAYTVDRSWFGKTHGMANAADSVVTVPKDLIRADEDLASTNKSCARFWLRRGAAGRVTFAPGTGVTLYADGAVSTQASVEIMTPGAQVEVVYIRTGTGTAEVWVRGAYARQNGSMGARSVKTGTAYTLVGADLGGFMAAQPAASTVWQLTIPAAVLPPELDVAFLHLCRDGAGDVQLVAGTGSTLKTGGLSKVASQDAVVKVILERTGTSTVNIRAVGSLVA